MWGIDQSKSTVDYGTAKYTEQLQTLNFKLLHENNKNRFSLKYLVVYKQRILCIYENIHPFAS